MDTHTVDVIIQYALAVARIEHDEAWQFRELGPLHLIKYVYLADLNHAEKTGESLTGAPWRFYHYGPWTRDVYLRLGPAAEAIGATERHFSSQYRDDNVRWKVTDLRQAEEVQQMLERQLPLLVALAVRRAVHEWANDTYALLHHVYATLPMLNAAPNEHLDFSLAMIENDGMCAEPAEPYVLRPKAVKKRREFMQTAKERLRHRLEERLKEREALRERQAPPRYDEVFFTGKQALDELAGEPLPSEGVLEFSDTVWKSSARKGGEDE